MSLAPGARLGPFEVISSLGAGGMGEVYRARDTRLHRDVALKVLPAAVADDPERLARFEREARTLASLNHPNIAHIHGLEGNALVMELVDGDDLSAVIARGALPVDEALAIARQIAHALDAAHSSGIIHRDLKPANVKVRADHTVKVLDFGLAKMIAPAAAQGSVAGSQRRPGDSSDSPTLTSPAVTQAGIILGTAAYMSPEQARGKAVDKRSDIWAFGCVFYEMLAGRGAFEGETMTDVLGSIVKSEPDWSKLPPETPDGVTRLLKRSLQKDPAKRLRDIGDAVAELDEAALRPPATVTDPATQTSRAPTNGIGEWLQARGSRRRALRRVLRMVVIGAAGAAIGYYVRPRPDPPLQKFHLAIQQDGGVIREPVISPDGRRVAYVGRSRIWVQEIDQWEPRELAGTEAAVRPFWSPAGDWIAYFRSESLLKVPATGGPVVRVATLPAVQAPLSGNSGVWTDDGMITISLATGPLLRVPSGGGEPAPVDVPQLDGVNDLHDLEPLPGGGFVAAIHRKTGVDAIGVLKDGNLRVVLEASNVGQPAYALPGHLIFQRHTPGFGLWAAPFSLTTLQITGDPFLIGEGFEPTIARDGTLAFLGRPEALARQLAWFSMDGKPGARVAEPREWAEGVAISPDGRRVLAAATDGIWSYDVETGARSRITSGSADITPHWVTSNTIVFVRTHGSQPAVMMKQIGAGSPERVLSERARFPHATADGRRIVFNALMDHRPGWQIAWMDLDKPSEIRRLGAPHEGARFPTVSPDGSLVAYISGEVGRDEVFLTTLPDGEGKWQLSTEGGGWTLFNPRGDAVLYRSPAAALMSVPISVVQGEVKVGQPRQLFEWGTGWMLFYDIARDGQRGIAAMPVDKASQVSSLSVVQNWHKEFVSR